MAAHRPEALDEEILRWSPTRWPPAGTPRCGGSLARQPGAHEAHTGESIEDPLDRQGESQASGSRVCADSAFHNHLVLAAAGHSTPDFRSPAGRNASARTAIVNTDPAAWTTIRYANAVFDQE
jgi:hypothetical protein